MIGPQERWYRFVRRNRGRQPEGHVPGETYNCRACDHPWPCPQARLSLLLDFKGDRTGLMMYLAGHLARALEALPDQHPAMIVGQIVYWVPRRRT